MASEPGCWNRRLARVGADDLQRVDRRRHVQTVAAHQSHYPVKQGTDTLAFLPQRMLENMSSPSAYGRRPDRPHDAIPFPSVQLLAVREVDAGVIAGEEEQPSAGDLAVDASGRALLDKAVGRRCAGAGANHDHRCLVADRRLADTWLGQMRNAKFQNLRSPQRHPQ